MRCWRSTSSRRCSRSAATRTSGPRSWIRSWSWWRTATAASRSWSPCAPTSTDTARCTIGSGGCVGANQVLVGPMRRDELRRAIEEPARRVGLQVEPSLTDALIADVLDQPGALPLLSAALLEQWREREGRVLRRAAYDRTGGVRGAVGRLAEQTYSGLSEPERGAARGILLRLADAGEHEAVFVRRRMALDELDRDEHTAARAGGAGRQPARDGGWRDARGRPRGAAARMAAPARLARGGCRGAAPAPAPDERVARLAGRRTRQRGALPRCAARVDARLGRRPRAGPERARARLPRREPRRGGARGRAPAAGEPPPAGAARRPRRAAGAGGGGRRRGAQPARRGPRYGAHRRRPAPRPGGARIRSAWTRPS